jgi:hypothetical protein
MPQLPPGQATNVLSRLVRDGRVTSADIARYISDIHRDIAELEARLERLRALRQEAQTTPARPSTRPPSSDDGRGDQVRRRRTNRRGNPLAGRYMGYMRQVKAARKKAEFRRIKEERGLPDAIAALRQHLGK